MSRVRIVAVGARGPLGMNALQVAMVARARQLVPRTLPWRDKRGRRIGACMSGDPEGSVLGGARLLALGAPALSEAAGGLSEPAPLFLALPDTDRPDAPEHRGMLAAIAGASGVRVDLERSRSFSAGQAAGAMAFEAALSALADRESVIVGGVESYVHPEVLRWLDEGCRLHARDALDGFVPSEGAAFAVLRAGRARKSEPLAPSITAARSGREDTVARDKPNLARALTAMVHELVDGAPGPVGWVLSDVNGERHRVREWSMVEIRASFADPLRHERLPDSMGDVGAASGAMAVALASTWWACGCAPAERALVALCSEGAERGVIGLEAPA